MLSSPYYGGAELLVSTSTVANAGEPSRPSDHPEAATPGQNPAEHARTTKSFFDTGLRRSCQELSHNLWLQSGNKRGHIRRDRALEG